MVVTNFETRFAINFQKIGSRRKSVNLVELILPSYQTT